MTSNLGSQRIQELTGRGETAQIRDAVLEVVQSHFRPEFINRLDEIVVFHPLGREHIRSIARIQLRHLEQRLRDREMGLDVDEAALDRLGEAGFDPVYGARPLKRAIQAQIENPLAQRILAGEFKPGDTIVIGLEGRQLAFRARRAAAA